MSLSAPFHFRQTILFSSIRLCNMNQTITAVIIVFALLSVGGIAGYYMANNSPTDDAEGMNESEINEILNGYAADLKEKGGAIGCNGAKHTINAGTDVRVENGALVYDYHNNPFNATYYIPYHAISYVYINI